MPSSESVGASPAYLAMLLADGRLPTGAHTQSGGLESAFASGLRLNQVPDYLRMRLRTVTEVEAAAAVVARHYWLSRPLDRREAVAEVDAGWRARTASDALREASDLLGRSLQRLAGLVWPVDLDPRVVSCRAVVVGATAAAAGLDAAVTARLVGFDDVQVIIAAALKLEPFDPALGVRWAAAAGPVVEAMVSRVAALTTVADLPAYAAPELESWAQAHSYLERRLFRA